jgi:hypothetical protein
MLVITAVSILMFAVVYTLSRGGAQHQWHLSESRVGIVTVGVQIICGDCSGNTDLPLKTYLDRHGQCAQCGGRSYMLASSRTMYAHRLARTRLSERESTTGEARSQSVGASTSLHGVRFRGLTA